MIFNRTLYIIVNIVVHCTFWCSHFGVSSFYSSTCSLVCAMCF